MAGIVGHVGKVRRRIRLLAPVAVRELAVERIDEPRQDVRRGSHAPAAARERPEAAAGEQGLDGRGHAGRGVVALEAVVAGGRGREREVGPCRSCGRGCRGPGCPPEGQKFASTIGIIAMPYVAWSSTRLPTIRSSRPPATTMPIPNGTYSYSFASTVVELLWWTWLPAIRTSRCGANGSESSVLGTIPARFFRHSLFTIARFAARVRAGVPERVVFGEHVGDHGVARVARADVEAGVGRAARVGVIEPSPARSERVDAVVAVRGRREVGASDSRAPPTSRSR